MGNGSSRKCFCLRRSLLVKLLSSLPLSLSPPLALSPSLPARLCSSLSPSLSLRQQTRENWRLPLRSAHLHEDWQNPSSPPAIRAVILEGNVMLELGLSWTGKVAGGAGRPGARSSHRLASQECSARVCSENAQTPVDFRISQPFLLHLFTFLLPPEMAPDLQETFERSYLLTDGKKWILHLII